MAWHLMGLHLTGCAPRGLTSHRPTSLTGPSLKLTGARTSFVVPNSGAFPLVLLLTLEISRL